MGYSIWVLSWKDTDGGTYSLGLVSTYSLVYEEYLRCFLTGTEKYFQFTWIWGLPVVYCIEQTGLGKIQICSKIGEEDKKHI